MKPCVFITGATNGTGFAIAERFAKENHSVFIGSRTAEKAEKAAQMLYEKYAVLTKGYGMKVFDAENVESIFADIRQNGYFVSVLVLNAANLGICQNTLTVDIQDFMDVINTNIGWNFMLARAAAKGMIDEGGGSIIFINSNTAYRSIPDRAAYCASKSGALGMMRALALDLGKYNL